MRRTGRTSIDVDAVNLGNYRNEAGFKLAPSCCDISVGELMEMGEEFEAAMIRSVNGGGVNSPYGAWDDMYDVFFAALEW